jgi:large subunit ribosomal protein L21
MYAIVKTGGKQYRVERGQRLLIDGLESVQVTAKVLAHVRGEKLRVFKFKPKRGYKRRTGHRQDLTQIEVTEISQGKAKAKAAAEKAAEQPSAEKAPVKAPADKPAAKAKAAADKPAAKAKAPAKAKPAAKAKAKAPAEKAKEESSDGS